MGAAGPPVLAECLESDGWDLKKFRRDALLAVAYAKIAFARLNETQSDDAIENSMSADLLRDARLALVDAKQLTGELQEGKDGEEQKTTTGNTDEPGQFRKLVEGSDEEQQNLDEINSLISRLKSF
jgi:hypothetical protein